jgi:aspartate racemase
MLIISEVHLVAANAWLSDGPAKPPGADRRNCVSSFASDCYSLANQSGIAAELKQMVERRLIGVLGGMGPLATVDFMQKVIVATPAHCDQDHVPMIVYSVPQIPDRVRAIAAGTDEPFPAILAGLRTLERAGCALVVMPCNTAHAWYDRLTAATDLEILHMADAVRQRVGDRRETIALMATTGTLSAGFYQRYLTSPARTVMVPTLDVQARIGHAIAAVKLNDLTMARQHMEAAAAALIAAGADRLLLACTELPLATTGTTIENRCLDATVCLAEASVAFSIGTVAGISGRRAI